MLVVYSTRNRLGNAKTEPTLLSAAALLTTPEHSVFVLSPALDGVLAKAPDL